jgi:hypothetical protein
MALKTFLIVLLTALGLFAKSQTLLNADSTRIKKQMLSQGAIKRHNVLTHHWYDKSTQHYEIDYDFPPSLIKKNGASLIVFYLTPENKCFKYLLYYYGYNHTKQLYAKFDDPNSGLKQVKGKLEWIDLKKNYKISVLTSLPVNGRIADTFILQYENM